MIDTSTEDAIRLARWTCSTGSNVQSRAAVVVQVGEHVWSASAEGNGAVDALFEAVDGALTGVLAGHPRLLAYRVVSLGEGPDAQGRVEVEVAPPAGVHGLRGQGRYLGACQGTNTVACSVEAYVEAINAMLAEVHWAGATDAVAAARAENAGGETSVAGVSGDAGGGAREVTAPSVEYDDIDDEPSRWFEP